MATVNARFSLALAARESVRIARLGAGGVRILATIIRKLALLFPVPGVYDADRISRVVQASKVPGCVMRAIRAGRLYRDKMGV
jgi:hypothetical protein